MENSPLLTLDFTSARRLRDCTALASAAARCSADKTGGVAMK